MARKGHGMPVVVRGVVHRLDVGKAHAADDEEAKQGRRENRKHPRRGQLGGACPTLGLLVDRLVIVVSLCPPPEGGSGCSSPAGLLACGSKPPFRLPRAKAPVASKKGSSPPTVAGAAAASRLPASHRVPVLRPAGFTLREPTTLKTIELGAPARKQERFGPPNFVDKHAMPGPLCGAKLTVSSRMRSEKGMR